MPVTALHDLFRLQQRWGIKGEVPESMCHARMVNLTKPKKVVKGRLHAKDTRPISVFSGVWRLFTGAWLDSRGMQTWIKEVLGDST